MNHLLHRTRINSGGLRQLHTLRSGQHVDVNYEIVRQFGDCTGPEIAEMENVGAGGHEERPTFFESTLIAPDHIAKGLGVGASLAATDLSVDHSNAFRFGQSGHPAHGSRMNSAMDCDHHSRSSVAKDTSLFDSESLNLGIIDYYQFDDLSMLTDFVSGASAFSAQRSQLLHWLG